MLKFILILTLTSSAFAAKEKTYISENQKISNEIIFQRSDVIWGFDFLSDERIIFTERGGKMGLFDPKTKKVTEITGVPAVYAFGQGGLLDVRVHPKNGLIYFTYSEPLKDKSTTAFATGKLVGAKLTEVKKLFLASSQMITIFIMDLVSNLMAMGMSLSQWETVMSVTMLSN